MKHIHYIILLLAVMLAAGTAPTAAQTDRQLIRQGNRAFKSQKWVDAETQYRKAVSKNQKNPQAIYNLGCALLAQQKDSLAMTQFANAAQLETNKLRRAKSYHNAGTVMQAHRDYAKAIEFYKMALRCNPADNETRYNLALCKKLLKDNQQNNQQNKNDKNKNGKDKNKNDKDKNKDAKDKKNGDNDKNDKDKKQKDKDSKNGQGQQNQDQMSRDNAEQLLNAAIQQEQATKQKMQKAMRQARGKNYEKNW